MLTSEGTGGTVTARAVARMYAALLGEVDGVRLVSPERLRQITAVAMTRSRRDSPVPVIQVAGVRRRLPGTAELPHPVRDGRSGGTAAYADAASGIAVAVTKNLVTYGGFNAFNQVGDIVTKALDGSWPAGWRVGERLSRPDWAIST